VAVLIFSLIFNSTLSCNSVCRRAYFPPCRDCDSRARLWVRGYDVPLAFARDTKLPRPDRALLRCVGRVLAYLWTRVGRCQALTLGSRVDAWENVHRLGWPIVLANGGLVLVQSADRLVGARLADFRVCAYSLAASTMFVPAAAILAVSRCFSLT